MIKLKNNSKNEIGIVHQTRKQDLSGSAGGKGAVNYRTELCAGSAGFFGGAGEACEVFGG